MVSMITKLLDRPVGNNEMSAKPSDEIRHARK